MANIKRYILRDEYQLGTDYAPSQGREVALRLVHELHEMFADHAVTEADLYAHFQANIDEVRDKGSHQPAEAWVRFLLRHSKEDGTWYREF